MRSPLTLITVGSRNFSLCGNSKYYSAVYILENERWVRPIGATAVQARSRRAV